MTPEPSYVPSRLMSGESEMLRNHCFTRWMSVDLLQAASDFLRNLRLLPIYAECMEGPLHRYLLWNPPRGSFFEVRSGRNKEEFVQFDQGNIHRGWPLLSLHISEQGIHSAVWISAPEYDRAVEILQRFGITAALRPSAK